MADPIGGGDEWRTALALLGGGGMALVLSLKSICGLLQRREQETGRALTADEVDSLLAVASAHPVLANQVRGMRRDLDSLTDKLDELLRRSSHRNRITDA
jgi:hypothetical protein